jgi:hypothetical protein
LVDDEPTSDWADELVARARSEGVESTGDSGLLTALVRQVLQAGLEVEMTDHLGYERHAAAGRNTGNSRNGSTAKTVTTEIGQVHLDVPRDRNATFEPVTVRKGQRRLDGLSGNVISLYAKGMMGRGGQPRDWANAFTAATSAALSGALARMACRTVSICPSRKVHAVLSSGSRVGSSVSHVVSSWSAVAVAPA